MFPKMPVYQIVVANLAESTCDYPTIGFINGGIGFQDQVPDTLLSGVTKY